MPPSKGDPAMPPLGGQMVDCEQATGCGGPIYNRSTIVAMPWPTPMHMVARP